MRKNPIIGTFLTKDILQKEYNELQSLNKIAKKYDISKETVRYYAKLYKIELNALKKYSYDVDFFSRENDISFYIAGFIAADGCVKKKLQKNKKKFRYTLQIGLSKVDRKILERIKKEMNSDHPIRDGIVYNSKRNPKWNDTETSSFVIDIKEKTFNDLLKFEITPRKSLTYKFPEWIINHPLRHHFLRGYNDGDGSFYIQPHTKGKANEQLMFSLRGTIDFLKVYKSILEKDCGVEISDKTPRISSGIGMLEYKRNIELAKISNYLYKDANIYLDRKINIIQKLLGVDCNSKDFIEKNKKKTRTILDKNVLESLYNEFKNVRAISKKLNVGYGIVLRNMNYFNIPYEKEKKEKKIPEKSKEYIFNPTDLQNKYDELGTFKDVAKEYNCNQSTIKRHMKKMDLKIKQKRQHNEDIFSQNNECEKQFYLAGFLALKSSVQIKGKNKKLISITNKNLDELEYFKYLFETNSAIRDGKQVKGFSIFSCKIVDDLCRFNIVSNKLYEYDIPNFVKNHEFLNHFIRGCIDARSYIDNGYLVMNGPEKYLKSIKDIFEKELGISGTIILKTKSGVRNYHIRFLLKHLTKIKEFIYNNSTIFLKRKLEFINKY